MQRGTNYTAPTGQYSGQTANSFASRASPRRFTLFLSGSVGSNGRNIAADVTKVQQRLVSLGFTWADDSTALMIQAIQLFQCMSKGSTKLNSYCSDGRIDVNGNTHNWLRSSNPPRWMLLDQTGPGYNFADEPSDKHHWGSYWLEQMVIKAGQIYMQSTYYKTARTPAIISGNDAALVRGGNTPDHATHECGLSLDIRLPRTDGGVGGVTYQSSGYSRDAARAIAKALWATNEIKTLYFNDPVLINEGLCTYSSGHDNHYHVVVSTPSVSSSPTYRSLSPASGPAQGGTKITINGESLFPEYVSAVYLGAPTNVCNRMEFAIDGTAMTCFTPANMALQGQEVFVVTTPDVGTTGAGNTFAAGPAENGVSFSVNPAWGWPVVADGSVPDPKCASLNGTCGEVSDCNGAVIDESNQLALCPGAANIRCCVPIDPSPLCTAQAGFCAPASQCAGTTMDGICTDLTTTCCFPPEVAPVETISARASGDSARCNAIGGSCVSEYLCYEGVVTSGLCSGPSSVKCCTPAPNANLRMNQNGIDMLGHFEGYSDTVYLDPIGLPTVCYGHLVKTGEKFPGRMTRAQCVALLQSDIAVFESCVAKLVTKALTSNQFSSIVDFAFNVGCGNLKGSTLLKRLNSGQFTDVRYQLGLWNKAGGQVLTGLVKRRVAEANLFDTPDNRPPPAFPRTVTIETPRNATAMNPSAGTAPETFVVPSADADLCPSGCSGNGNCPPGANGTQLWFCHCNDGFYGHDCSRDANAEAVFQQQAAAAAAVLQAEAVRHSETRRCFDDNLGQVYCPANLTTVDPAKWGSCQPTLLDCAAPGTDFAAAMAACNAGGGVWCGLECAHTPGQLTPSCFAMQPPLAFCQAATPFRCPSGACAADAGSCPTPSVAPVACPLGQVPCGNGLTCAATAAACALIVTYDGCPSGMVSCPGNRLVCVATASQCLAAAICTGDLEWCGLQRSADGAAALTFHLFQSTKVQPQCVANCSIVSGSTRVTSGTVVLSMGPLGGTLELVSEGNDGAENIAVLRVPARRLHAASNSSLSTIPFLVRPVPDSVLVNGAFAAFATRQTLVAPVFDLRPAAQVVVEGGVTLDVAIQDAAAIANPALCTAMLAQLGVFSAHDATDSPSSVQALGPCTKGVTSSCSCAFPVHHFTTFAVADINAQVAILNVENSRPTTGDEAKKRLSRTIATIIGAVACMVASAAVAVFVMFRKRRGSMSANGNVGPYRRSLDGNRDNDAL